MTDFIRLPLREVHSLFNPVSAESSEHVCILKMLRVWRTDNIIFLDVYDSRFDVGWNRISIIQSPYVILSV